MTAEILAFGQPHARAANDQPPVAATPRVSPKFAAFAKRAAIVTLTGALGALRFAAYVVLFSLRGVVRGLLGLIGGLSFLALLFAWFLMPADYEPRQMALIGFGVSFAVCGTLSVLYNKVLFLLAREGDQL